MCVVSMVIATKTVEWERRYPPIPEEKAPWPGFYPSVQLPTQEEIDEFRRLLEAARQYDIDHNQPECELDEKKDRIRKLAERLEIKINFI